jgi:phospholipid/cholesterol/gamma-HCH transport system permease protein
VLLAFEAVGALVSPARAEGTGRSAFGTTLVRQLSWMLALGIPVVGLVHAAMGSFLALQAYYGSTFIDGTGAVVGVGLLRNLGGLMTGMMLAALLAARMIPELRRQVRAADSGGRRQRLEDQAPLPAGRLAAPRIAAAAVACLLLSQWGIAVGTVVGWQSSTTMMGLPSETFFLMMTRMLWIRDVVGLVVKGLIYGTLAAAVCCFEGLRGVDGDDAGSTGASIADAGAPPLAMPIYRATCVGIVAILIVNLSWFILVYHAVPFYGPTLLKPPAM